MRAMKESGIPWIGLIPDEWTRSKIKNVCSVLGSGTTPDSHILDYYDGDIHWIQSGDIYGKSEIVDTFANVTALALRASSALKVYRSPFVVMAMYGGSVGNIAISSINACSNQACCCMKPNNDVAIRFLYYWLDFCKQDFLVKAEGGGQPNISQNKIKNQFIYLPSICEQERIVAFLDAKCAEIDALSADIQAEIDTLEAYKRSVITEAVTRGLDRSVPMKDSGIEWVGEIPAHWGVEKGKYCLRYVQKPTKPDDDVITCFRDGEVTLRKNRREEGFTISLKEIGYQGIDVGDLIVHGMDGFAGSIGISDSRGKASPVLNVLDTDHNKRYIMYYLRSLAFNGVFLALSTGIRVRTCDTNWGKLRELLYVLPPKDEQEAIVQFVDDKLKSADEIISQKREQLAVLDDYKKSIIYEYVTGKKEVV